MRVVLWAVVGVAGFASASFAQVPAVSIAVGEYVAVRVPPSAFADGVVPGNDEPVRVADVVRAENVVRVNGSGDWAASGLVPAAACRIVELGVDRVSHRLVITLERPSGDGRTLRLSMPVADTAFLLPRLLAVAADTIAVQSAAFDAVRRRVFSGAAGLMPVASQTRTLRNAQFLLRYDSVRVVTFEDRPHLQLTARESAYTCGIGPASDSRRLGEALQEAGFPIIRDVGRGNDSMSGAFGLAIVVALKAASCGNGGSGDVVTMFVSADAARQFAADEISDQDLVDRSSVIFKGKPTEVHLRRPPSW
jgi:hypothetical protein